MSMIKPGLLLSTTKIEVEDVKNAHKKGCEECGTKPARRRLKITKGAGKHAKTVILCRNCGRRWLKDRAVEMNRAIRRLNDEDVSCRLSKADRALFSV